jgi:hypothetical protein
MRQPKLVNFNLKIPLKIRWLGLDYGWKRKNLNRLRIYEKMSINFVEKNDLMLCLGVSLGLNFETSIERWKIFLIISHYISKPIETR